MRFSLYKMIGVGLSVLLTGLPVVRADVPNAEATKSLTDKVGAFRAAGAASISEPPTHAEEIVSYALRKYKAPSGKTYLVDLRQTTTAAAAYSLLTKKDLKLGVVGAASVAGPNSVVFCKGANLVGIFSEDRSTPAGDEITELASAFAQQLDGENDIPALVKHLPQWEKFGLGAEYAVTINHLKTLLPNQPILDAISFEGGAESVVAHYDAGTLAIIEFNTPQLATTNDYNIRTKINDLHAQIPPAGTPSLPTAYRRVGNYAVFVFDAPSQEAANQLIDQVKYEQVVQWLGENPFSYEKATREFTETTLGVLVAVVKTSGLALLTCLAVGGFFGALLFRFRRAQQQATEAYSDADAMIRLNLDELTPESDPGRLLGRGE